MKQIKPKLRCPFCGQDRIFECTGCNKHLSSEFVSGFKREYALLPILKGQPIIKIQEESKEDFIEMMDWTEKEFKNNTLILFT